jgi:hypothetical protein
MSIGEFTMAEAALSQQAAGSPVKKPPPKRQIIAQADVVAQPEPR